MDGANIIKKVQINRFTKFLKKVKYSIIESEKEILKMVIF